jgi:hypothetical protein
MIMMWSMYSDRDNRLSDAAVDVAISVSNYGLATASLTGANYLETLQLAGGLAVSSDGADIIKLSEAQYSAQAKAMREHADNLFELGRGILIGTARPFRADLLTACCVIL